MNATHRHSLPSRTRSVLCGTLLLAVGLLCGCASSGSGGGRAEPAVGTSVMAMDDPSSRELRSYLIHPPSGGLSQAAVSLVVVLHGGGSSAAEIERLTGFSDLADRERFVVVYPEATGKRAERTWNAGFCCGQPAREGVDDVGFVLRVVEHVTERIPVDRERVYLVGYSDGGMLAYRVAAEHPEQLAAFAVVGGAIGGRGPGEAEPRVQAPARLPLALMVVHGLDDQSVPYWEAPGSRGIAYVNVTKAVEQWVRGNGCGLMPSMKDERDGQLLLRSFRGRAAVEVVVLKGWGHDWPSRQATDRLPEGAALRGFDAAEVIWRFFAGKVRAAAAAE